MQLAIGPWLAIAMVLAFLLPNHYEPWLSFHQEALAFVAFAPVLLLLKRLDHVPRIVVIGLGIFAISPLIQFLVGQIYFLGDALVHAYYMVYAVGVGFVGYSSIVRKISASNSGASGLPSSLLDYLFSALLFASLVSVGLALHQWLELDVSGLFVNDRPRAARPFGNLAQPNHLSLLLVLGMISIWRMWESVRIGAIGAAIAMMWLLVGAVLADSRAFLLGAASFLIIFILLRKKCRLRASYLALILLSCLFVAMVQAKGWMYQALMLAGSDGEAARIESIHARAMIWRLLWEAILDRPWLGYGWGMVASVQLKYAAMAPEIGELFFNAHNWLLDLMVFVGVPVAVAVTAAGMLWFFSAIRLCVSADGMAVLLVPVLVIAYSTVEFQFAYSYFLLPAAYCAGLALSSGRTGRMQNARRYESVFRHGMATWILMLTCLIGILIAVDYFRFEAVWQRERFVMARIDPDGVRPSYSPFVLTNLKGLLELERVKKEDALGHLGLERIGATAARYPYIPFVIKWAWALRGVGRIDDGQRLIDAVCLREGSKRCVAIRRSVEGY